MRPAALAVALCALAACRGAGDGLPRIDYGRQTCARCGMAIGEERFASGYVDPAGETVAYDDVGEFLEAASKDSALAAKSYVHDTESGRWLAALRAVYLRIPGMATPMGSGYAAFSSEEEGLGFVRRLGLRPEGSAITLARK